MVLFYSFLFFSKTLSYLISEYTNCIYDIYVTDNYKSFFDNYKLWVFYSSISLSFPPSLPLSLSPSLPFLIIWSYSLLYLSGNIWLNAAHCVWTIVLIGCCSLCMNNCKDSFQLWLMLSFSRNNLLLPLEAVM